MSLTDKYMVQSVFYAVKVRKIKYKKIDPKKLEKKIIRLNKRLQNAEKKAAELLEKYNCTKNYKIYFKYIEAKRHVEKITRGINDLERDYELAAKHIVEGRETQHR